MVHVLCYSRTLTTHNVKHGQSSVEMNMLIGCWCHTTGSPLMQVRFILLFLIQLDPIVASPSYLHVLWDTSMESRSHTCPMPPLSHFIHAVLPPHTHTQITAHTSPASHSCRGWFSCSAPPHRHPFLPSSPHHSHPLFLFPTSFIPLSSSGTVAKEPWWPDSFLIGQKQERKKGGSKGRWEGERG